MSNEMMIIIIYSNKQLKANYYELLSNQLAMVSKLC